MKTQSFGGVPMIALLIVLSTPLVSCTMIDPDPDPGGPDAGDSRSSTGFSNLLEELTPAKQRALFPLSEPLRVLATDQASDCFRFA